MPFDGVHSNDKVSRTLSLARDIISSHGWLKGRAGDDGGPRCVTGAIVEAAKIVRPGTLDYEICDLFRSSIDRYITAVGLSDDALRRPTCVQTWQDASERTLSEVLAGFDSAISNS